MHSGDIHLGWRPASTDASGDADHLLIKSDWNESTRYENGESIQPIVRFTDARRQGPASNSQNEPSLSTPPNNQDLLFSDVQDQGLTSPTILWDANDDLDDIATSNPLIAFDEAKSMETNNDQGNQTVFS